MGVTKKIQLSGSLGTSVSVASSSAISKSKPQRGQGKGPDSAEHFNGPGHAPK